MPIRRLETTDADVPLRLWSFKPQQNVLVLVLQRLVESAGLVGSNVGMSVEGYRVVRMAVLLGVLQTGAFKCKHLVTPAPGQKSRL